MFCSHCGSATSQQDSFCRTCGRARDVRTSPAVIRTAVAAADYSIPLAIVGVFVGALIGFLMRPSVFLVGQLPFGVVATRGAYLTGINQLLRSTAESSFNQMAAAAIVGGLAGVFAGFVIKSVSAHRA